MPESTAKKQLLEEELGTPAKKIVSRDINSWMETREKSIKNKNASVVVGQFRFKVIRRLPPKYGSQDRKQEINEGIGKETPNISALKKRKDDLMKTVSNKKWLNQNTKPNTAEASTGGNKKPLEWLMNLPLIHVNQFVEEERDRKDFQQVTLIPHMKPFPAKNNAITSRKSSLRKIDRKENESSNPFCYYKELRQINKKNNSAEGKEILKEKLCSNNYKGLLSSGSRKASKLNFELKLDKYTVRI